MQLFKEKAVQRGRLTTEDISVEDSILMENSSNRIQLQEKDVEVLHGVYNINKGYAVFRKIVIIDKNEDYAIVEKGTTYGIAQFDYIVLDAADVKESEITVN